MKISSLERISVLLPEHGTEASQPEETPGIINLSRIMTRISKYGGLWEREARASETLGLSKSRLEGQKGRWA